MFLKLNVDIMYAVLFCNKTGYLDASLNRHNFVSFRHPKMRVPKRKAKITF